MRALSPAARDEASVSRRVDQSEAASNPEPTNDAGFIVR
jgi:hypothetical protein